MSDEIVPWDIDEASYIGSEDDGVYFQTGQGPDGKWYVTCVVDSETGAFVDTPVKDDGPYETEEQARDAGRDFAYNWCCENDVDTGDHGDYPD